MAKLKNSSLKAVIKNSLLPGIGVVVDPVKWMEDNFGVELFSNQIEAVGYLFDLDISIFSVLSCRGAGKTIGVAWGLAAYMKLFPGLRVIIVGPKEKQAGRLIKEMVTILKDKKCKINDDVDWARTSALRLQYKNGSYAVALSGQEGANVEGEHGHILVIDEAHLVPSYSVTNKLTPMIGMLEFSKIVKIGVSMGRNHFYKTCATPGAKVSKCPWNKAEIFLSRDKNPVFYKKKQYPRALIERMPLPYKQKYFPDRPDLLKPSGAEISTLDWETQYELEWADDISNFLSDEDQELLSCGEHKRLERGLPGEDYFAGLDTAQGSITGRQNTDETALSIWRRVGGRFEKVATFIWKGDPLGQIEEIWEIINPQTGLFKCKLTLVDYSNIGIDVVELFKRKGVPILGKHFQQTEKDSKRNWKNAMFNYFLVQLQTGNVKYPSIKQLELDKVEADAEERIRIANMLRGFWEWTTLQRIRGRGLNDTIEAPEETVDAEEGESGRAYDDICCADVMACWAAGKTDSLMQELAKGGDLSDYKIPLAVVGVGTMSGAGQAHSAGSGAKNPLVNPPSPGKVGSVIPNERGSSWLGGILNGAGKRK